MIAFKDYIVENSGVKASLSWMKEKYKEFNEALFNNELPECELEAKKLKKRLLGMFSFKEKIWLRNQFTIRGSKHYRIMKSENGKLKPVSNILDIHPAIALNTDGYFRDELAMESTFIHEMIHFYTYKDGYAPAIAHGKDFTTLCTIIGNRAKKKYNKEFDLSIYADIGKFSVDDETKKKDEERLKRLGLAVLIVSVKNDKYPERVIFLSPSSLQLFINQIHKAHDRLGNLEKIFYLDDVTSLADVDYFDSLVKSRKYGTFYIPENVPEIWDQIILSPKLEILYDSTKQVVESKIMKFFRKVKEKIMNLFIKPETNLSVEDIEKIGIIEPTELENA